TWDQHNALGSGSIDFDKFFRSLNDVKYDGVLVVEVKDATDVIKSLEFIEMMI
ncbi:MAG: sugar phosphate isomerase/epimerase, partial [Methanobacterium sp.]|nr:sugar phosphate isomerase/epimerase [Methanobacterium sp.]